jgi:hypothetical protein
MIDLDTPTPAFPAQLTMMATTSGGAVVYSDRYAVHFPDGQEAWQATIRLMHPLLNTIPAGNC